MKTLIPPNGDFAIIGDFNLPDFDWKELTTTTLQHYEIFTNFLIDIDPITQIINRPTRDDKILDIVITNASYRFSESEVIHPLGNSDHNIITFELSGMQIAPKRRFLNFFKS